MSFTDKLSKLTKIINDPGRYHSEKNTQNEQGIKNEYLKETGIMTTKPSITIVNSGSGYLSSPTSSTIAPGSTLSSYGGFPAWVAGTPTAATTFTRSVIHGTSVISLYGRSGQKIVELKEDGSVVWDKEIQIDEAAEAFGHALTLSSEQKVGITSNVKSKMRDSVFNDLIEIARGKGSLSAEDLAYLLSASKIIEKLKGKE